MYLIQKANIDNLENHYSQALYYTNFAHVATREEAEEFCASKGYISRDESWVAKLEDKPQPRFTWYHIPELQVALAREKPTTAPEAINPEA